MALVSTPSAGTPATAPAQTGAAPANENSAEFKAAKAAAAKKHAEKVKAAREADHKAALEARDEAQKLGLFDKLSEGTKKWLLAKCVPPSERAVSTGPSFFTQIFGDNPIVGTVITLNDVIRKTFKGMDTMKSYIKKWEAKGTVIKTELNQADMLQTKYTLVKIG